jgi:uncharacterized phage-associated protein
MFDSDQREKLLNAIIYFVSNTKRCHTLKLFKLLNFLDFEHFRQTGFGVTGLDYKAWAKGPVPSALWHEINRGGDEDLRKAVTVFPIKDELSDALVKRVITARAPFDASYFSRRELDIMQKLAEIFSEVDGNDMSSISHLRNLPWRKVFKRGEGNRKTIPYELARTSDPIIGSLPTLSDEEYECRKAVYS